MQARSRAGPERTPLGRREVTPLLLPTAPGQRRAPAVEIHLPQALPLGASTITPAFFFYPSRAPHTAARDGVGAALGVPPRLASAPQPAGSRRAG